ncbi:polysaccharide deacetylase family protein [Catalinimonas niigatensis]|uniref:polysaccharide deacetylase family protein n=1 Tax=Catalinimonas niigatensis TaxID=1397264 RepID=UPI002665D0EF|nr:polysaccharide deacetylase family protein [Catalinimonas niigatensis]WPP49321.1 polysaccharide deacetylase family protein [Catalinimonas niigatensis]
MKQLFFLLIFCFFSNFLSAQDQPVRLIIRSDDMGFSHAANLALIETYEKGITTSIEVMVPTPWFPEAVQLLKEHPGVDVGIHITLTSEWSNVKWRPLTKAPSISDENGYFYPMVWPNDNYGPDQALKAQNWDINEIEQEIRAQIEMAVRNIPRISHLSAHMGCTSLAPEVAEIYRKLAKEYKLDIHPEDMQVKRASYEGPKKSAEQKKQSFMKMLKALKSGTYMFVDHPAYDVPEMQAIHHTGYEDVALDRQGVTDILTDPDIIQLIKELNIELISYADLKKVNP